MVLIPQSRAGSKPALDWYGQGVAMAGYGLLCLHIIGLSVLGLTDPEAYIRAAWREVGWAEQLTAAWYACAGLFVFVAAARAGGATALTRGIYILGGVALVFFAGEEVSWGQHYFNIPVPGWVEEANVQGELNIHNLSFVKQSLFGDIFRHCRMALCVTTIAAFFCGRDRLFGVALPSMPLVVGILVAEPVHANAYATRLVEVLFHQSNVLLLLLAIGALISGRARALPLIVSGIVMVVAVAYSMMQVRFAVNSGLIYELQEYLFAVVCLWYAAELLVAEGRFEVLTWVRRNGLEWPAALNVRRISAVVGALTIAAGAGLALLVYFGYEHEDQYIENIYNEQVAGLQPTVRGAFDIYAKDGLLYYLKEECAEQDVAASFFLHIYPVQMDSLPADRRQHGFANLDFEFAARRGKWGAMADGKCAVVVELPDYPIARISTGQYVPGEGRLWEVEFAPPARPAP